jgi:hypothetical protein
MFAAIVLSYFAAYTVFGIKLRKMRDGFYIRAELLRVGVVGALLIILWLVYSALRVRCLFPSCSVLILWVVLCWMFTWSIIMPLWIASKDPRFSYTSCFRKPFKPRMTMSSTGSHVDDVDEMSDYHSREGSTIGDTGVVVKDVVVEKELTPQQLAQLQHVPLRKFLTYPAGREAFRTFTVLEFSVENLLFVEAVQEMKDRVHTKDEVRALYDRFVVEGAPNQVNLPAVIVHRLQPRLQDDCDAQVFTEAVDHMYKVMQRDTYKRFQKTREWAMHVGVFEGKVKDHGKTNSVEMTKQTGDKAQNEMPSVAVTVDAQPGNASAPVQVAVDAQPAQPSPTEASPPADP